jgi:hypothetical protein
MTPEQLWEWLWRLAAPVGKVVDALPDMRWGRHVAGQLPPCGTPAPPNYDESSHRKCLSQKLSRCRPGQTQDGGGAAGPVNVGPVGRRKSTDIAIDWVAAASPIGLTI